MGILDGIVEWIAEQVMNILDLITTSVLGALGCSMDTFLRYFPAAETMYQIFLALAIGLILLNWVWQLFKNYFMGTGIDAEDPIKLSLRTFMLLFLTFYAKDVYKRQILLIKRNMIISGITYVGNIQISCFFFNCFLSLKHILQNFLYLFIKKSHKLCNLMSKAKYLSLATEYI